MAAMDISSRRTSPYDALARHATPVSVTAGVSSYFTAPEKQLDPALFTPDERLHPPVRRWLLDTLYGFMRNDGLAGATSWAIPWIAGSGASYQWSAARDPGDLDILIGVDYVRFREDNPRLRQLSDAQIGALMNERMKAQLWPQTARAQVGTGNYEVTWYVNPHSTDIRAIHPYAAYNVLHNDWTVRPIDLPEAGPSFDPTWHAAADADLARANDIVTRYGRALDTYSGAAGTAAQRNALASLNAAVSEGAEMFDEIHHGRRQAFSDQGAGYADWTNFRWQAGKARGTVQALHAIKTAQQEAAKTAHAALYGSPLSDADTVLRKALGG